MARTQVTGGDLFELRKVADQHIPTIHNQFADANHTLDALGDDSHAVFSHSDEVGHEPYPPWNTLRLTIMATLGVNAARLELARQGALDAIAAFVNTDELNSDDVMYAADGLARDYADLVEYNRDPDEAEPSSEVVSVDPEDIEIVGMNAPADIPPRFGYTP